MSDTDLYDDFSEFDDLDDFDDLDATDDDQPLDPARQQKLEKFQKNVAQAMKVLGNERSSVDNRIKAAQWLGESGEPTAITSLRQAYMNDSDKKVRQAAGYSLGMFRALQKALNDPKRADEVSQVLEQIIFEGKMGRSSGLKQNLKYLQIILVISFVVLIGAGLLMGSGLFGDNLPEIIPSPTIELSDTPVPTIPAIDVMADIQSLHDDLVFDGELLASRFQRVLRGESQACEVTEFRQPEMLVPPPGFDASSAPAVEDLINRLNTTRNELSDLRAIYDESCASGVPIPMDIADTNWTALTGIQGRLNNEIAGILNNADLIAGEVIPSLTPRPTATLFPTATLEPSVINRHLLTLQFNIDDMNQPISGRNNRLIQFWSDLELAGQTDACRDGAPEDLPLDYTPPPDELAELPIDLQNAIASYNLAMALTRESWTLFEQACEDPEGILQNGKAKAELAKTSFDDAENLLSLLDTD